MRPPGTSDRGTCSAVQGGPGSLFKSRVMNRRSLASRNETSGRKQAVRPAEEDEDSAP
jgi:hypothetical protein